MNDEDIIEFVTEFRKGIVGTRPSRCMCFMVCAPLATLLGLCGVPVKVRTSDAYEMEHYWLEMDDGRALDPTADQFNDMGLRLPPVYLGAPMAIHERVS